MSSPSARNNSDFGTAREGASTNFELESGQRGPPSDAPSLRNIRSADIENRISSWVCVLGAFIFLLPSYGFPQAIGTVQAYLQEHQLSGYSARDIGWVTGLYTALTLFLGIQAGPIVDRYGTKVLAPLSTALTLPTFFLLAECKYYWQFMLCLGIYGGIGGALASTVAVSVVGKIFTRLRGLAIGLALTGSALGGVVFPFLLRELFPKYGWAWSMRFVGFTIAGVMIPGTLCFIPFAKLSRNHHHTQLVIPSQPSADSAAPTPRLRAASATINFAAFRVPAFSLIAAAFFLLEFVIFGISGIFPTLANWAGYPADTGYNIVAIVNGCGCISRIGAGFLGDKLGHYNVLFTSTCVTIVCVAVTILPFGTTHIQALYYGQANIFLATCSALMATAPDVEVHLASFAPIKAAVAAASEVGMQAHLNANPIKFHEIHGTNYFKALLSPEVGGRRLLEIAPSLRTMPTVLQIIARAAMPYTGPEMVENCNEIRRIIEQVGPDLTLVDNMFTPGLTMARHMGIKWMILSPNTLKDLALPLQPKAAFFWKYPW
ncbi:hypothetical protein K4K52_000990 [Colletotrichum sp. SAR 10_76]|nr:hypothetical protein K4K52_000990 [Colletotrichum sp. SAR 10_76]